MKTLLGFLSGLLVLTLALGSNARAESLEHVDRLAVEVRERANFVCWELYGTCRAQPAYDQVYRDAKEVWSIAGHIHDLVHNSANQGRIQRNAVEMDQLLTKIRMQISTWGNHGHPHGCTFELKQKLAALDYAVKHLLEDVGAQPQMPMYGGAVGPQMMPAGQTPMMSVGQNPMMPAGPNPMLPSMQNQMLPAGPSQMTFPNQSSGYTPGPMPNQQPMGQGGYQPGMPQGTPAGYNPQTFMSFFPGATR